jgi:shikimate kinase
MSNPTVFTFAWTDGARAEAIARAAAARLGYRYVSDEIVARAAELAGVDAADIASAEHRETLATRIMRSLSAIPSPDFASAGAFSLDRGPEYRALIQNVVDQLATEGSVVIGSHGAGMRLRGTPGTFRVFVTASPESRVARVAEERGLAEEAARKEVENTDRERKAFFERFFHLGAELPTHYDLVINTDALTVEQAVAIVVARMG